jgi:hypothetical protein
MEGSPDDIQPLSRDPLRFDLLQLFEARLDAQGGTLQDPKAHEEFVASLGQPLTRAVADSTLLSGLHTEAMFEALVVSLGRIKLIKHEDTRPAWTTRRGLKIPDYQIVLSDGTRFLAEVKHFHQGDKPTKAFPVSPSYLRGLRAYGELVGCPVKLAVYWEQWNIWTLVPLLACEHSKRASLTMGRALKVNEMGLLGDLHVGTRFPLRFRLAADPERHRRIGEDGEVAFTIGGVELYCGGRRLIGKREWTIAMWFMLYGSWEEEATAKISGGELVAVDITRTPPADNGQGFEFIGTLSSLFSSMYRSSTSDADRVTRLGIKVVSGSLKSLIPDDYKSEALPLWRIQQVAEKSSPGGQT